MITKYTIYNIYNSNLTLIIHTPSQQHKMKVLTMVTIVCALVSVQRAENIGKLDIKQ